MKLAAVTGVEPVQVVSLPRFSRPAHYRSGKLPIHPSRNNYTIDYEKCQKNIEIISMGRIHLLGLYLPQLLNGSNSLRYHIL